MKNIDRTKQAGSKRARINISAKLILCEQKLVWHEKSHLLCSYGAHFREVLGAVRLGRGCILWIGGGKQKRK